MVKRFKLVRGCGGGGLQWSRERVEGFVALQGCSDVRLLLERWDRHGSLTLTRVLLESVYSDASSD